MNNAGSAAPVFNAGGGGFQYEDEVAAFVLAAMLVGQPPFGADIGLVQRINWQRQRPAGASMIFCWCAEQFPETPVWDSRAQRTAP